MQDGEVSVDHKKNPFNLFDREVPCCDVMWLQNSSFLGIRCSEKRLLWLRLIDWLILILTATARCSSATPTLDGPQGRPWGWPTLSRTSTSSLSSPVQLTGVVNEQGHFKRAMIEIFLGSDRAWHPFGSNCDPCFPSSESASSWGSTLNFPLCWMRWDTSFLYFSFLW